MVNNSKSFFWKIISFFFPSVDWWRCRRILQSIELIALDVDGVLTDGGLWYDSEGNLIKRFDVRDGLAIRLLQNIGLTVVFVSGGKGGATEYRAKHLGIKYCLVEAKDKVCAIESLSKELEISMDNIIFVGDDLNDLVVKGRVGLLVVPSDATKSLLDKADIVLTKKGGNGAFRELAEKLLKIKGLWKNLNEHGWRDINH